MKGIKNIDKALLVLTILLIVFAAYLAFSGGFRTFMLNQNENEQLIIPKADIKECCTYLDENSIERTCTVFSDYDCSKCESICSP